MPKASVIASSTTAEAGRQAAEDGDPTVAVIVGDEAVELYGLTVLEHDVGDTLRVHALRLDRAVHARRPRAARRAHRVHVCDEPQAGRAVRGDRAVRARGLDLVRLVSRPLPATPWKYRFDAVVAGHPLEPAVQVALRELDAVTRTLRVVGVYEGHAEEGA